MTLKTQSITCHKVLSYCICISIPKRICSCASKGNFSPLVLKGTRVAFSRRRRNLYRDVGYPLFLPSVVSIHQKKKTITPTFCYESHYFILIWICVPAVHIGRGSRCWLHNQEPGRWRGATSPDKSQSASAFQRGLVTPPGPSLTKTPGKMVRGQTWQWKIMRRVMCPKKGINFWKLIVMISSQDF